MKIKDLTLLKQLGKGTMGEVFISQKEGNETYFATKKIDRKKADRKDVRKYFRTELEILQKLKHKNIVRFYDLKQTSSHYYIVMEYCNGGSLMSCLDKYMKLYRTPFSEKITQYLMKQIVSGLKYIHRHGIIHRDIKLDNILVKFYNDDDLKNLNMMGTHLKITDFGISIRPGENNLAFTALGSPVNMDPFILKKLSERNDLANSEGYDQSCDIWSLGSICYEMLMGKRVFNGRTVKDLRNKVEKGNYILPTTLSKEAVSFINGMLQYDPKKRLNIEELSRHQFLTRNVKNFRPIDFSLIYSKIGEKGIVVNTKNNKTMWQVFNNNNSGIQNNNTIINNNNITDNPSNMWDIFNKETELKLSMISPKELDQVPFSESETTNDTFNIYNINNQTNKINNNIKNDTNYNNMINNNNINNNQFINNNQKQYKHLHSDNNIYRKNYNNLNMANSQIPFDYKYPKEFSGFDNYNNKFGLNQPINNFGEMKYNQFESSPMINQNLNMNFYQGNNINNNNNFNPQINQTQINPQNTLEDIKIQKRVATTDESCLHQ